MKCLRCFLTFAFIIFKKSNNTCGTFLVRFAFVSVIKSDYFLAMNELRWRVSNLVPNSERKSSTFNTCLRSVDRSVLANLENLLFQDSYHIDWDSNQRRGLYKPFLVFLVRKWCICIFCKSFYINSISLIFWRIAQTRTEGVLGPPGSIQYLTLDFANVLKSILSFG